MIFPLRERKWKSVFKNKNNIRETEYQRSHVEKTEKYDVSMVTRDNVSM